jgi:hypothetical protein
LIIGRHLFGPYEIQNYGTAIFGEEISKDQEFLDAPIRMKNGSAVAIKNVLFNDNRLEMARNHSSNWQRQVDMG